MTTLKSDPLLPKKTGFKKAGGKSIGAVRRRTVDVSATGLVETEPLRPDDPLPLLARPRVRGVSLLDWIGANREQVNRLLLDHGAMLFRGFHVGSSEAFEELIRALSGQLLVYKYRSTPRTRVGGRIYTSTEYPPELSIPMHNEMSYSGSWPKKIWFHCVKAAPVGGETPIADSRKVYECIDPDFREHFIRKGVMYVRNYSPGLDLPWQEVFNTESRAEVEAFCEAAGMQYEWRAEDHLRTRQVCRVVLDHPATGERVWFNQAHLFHVSGLAPEIRKNLLEAVPEEDLPRNAYHADGSPIDGAELDKIRRIYDELEVVFKWQEGDVLLADNILTAHSRRPFEGERKILAGLAEEMTDA